MPDDAARSGTPGSGATRTHLLSRRSFLALGVAASGAAVASRSVALAAEPRTPRSVARARHPRLSREKLDAIVTVAIHPGVGIARVGNSEDAFFIGPEVVGATLPAAHDLRDGRGRVARQAARFRVYGYDADGKVVGELTARDASVDWSVHLANRKSAWYRFGRAMDIPEATAQGRRNASVGDRSTLVLDAGRHATSEGTPVALRATAKGVRMLLGELLLDDAGRLIVLPGKGRAASWKGRPVTTFANNDTWFDDVADGPVTATVTIGDRRLEATPAWVATAPPNYAPAMATGWKTMHDLLEDVWVTAGMLPLGDTISFRRHIRPLFTRLAALQWVNAGILRDHGWNARKDLSDPVLLAKLADPSPANEAFRMGWVARFRDIDSGKAQPNKLPPMLGDVAGVWSSPRAWIGPTPLQRYRLDEWAAGRFESDGIDEPEVPARLADLPLAQRPRSLDRAALEGVLAEAFDPGCELPWAMRRARLWDEPYRIKVRHGPEPDFGPTLRPSVARGPHGPLEGSVPGALTRWMALPWQTDTINCRAGYRPQIDTLLDTFWAGRVPNHVLTRADYAIVMDTHLPLTNRRAAFRRRRDWWRGMLTTDYVGSLNRMVRRWHELGFVLPMPGPADGAFPTRFGVEVGRRLPEPALAEGEPAPLLPRDAEREP